MQEARVESGDLPEALDRKERSADRKAEPGEAGAEFQDESREPDAQSIAVRTIQLQGPLGGVEVGKGGRARVDAGLGERPELRHVGRAAAHDRQGCAEPLGERADHENVRASDASAPQ